MINEVHINRDGLDFCFDAGPDPEDLIRKQIVENNRFFEQSLLEYIEMAYPIQETILDIGANFGNHAMFFDAFLNYRLIVCFEPCKPTFDLLEKNAGQFAVLHNVALGSRNGHGVGSMAEEHNAGTFTVSEQEDGDIPIRKLDSYGLRDVSLIKIDAEGMDAQVIKGGIETIEACHPVIFVEVLGAEYLQPILDLLSPLGYSGRNMSEVSPDLGTTWEFV